MARRQLSVLSLGAGLGAYPNSELNWKFSNGIFLLGRRNYIFLSATSGINLPLTPRSFFSLHHCQMKPPGIHWIQWLLLAVICLSCQKDNKVELGEPAYLLRTEKADTLVSLRRPQMVRNVRTARNGDVLIAAFRGIWRFDGDSFSLLTATIPSPNFWDVMEDRKGHLWFGTKDSGVYHYDGHHFLHFTTRHGLAHNFVGFMYEDKAGSIWFATGGGLSRYDGKTLAHYTAQNGLPFNGHITTMMEDRNGTFWFGSRGDAFTFDGKIFRVFRDRDGKAFHNVWSILEDQKGQIWLAGSKIQDKQGSTLFLEEGIWRYDGKQFTKLPSEKGASAMLEDQAGNIWMAGGHLPGKNGSLKLSRYAQKSLYSTQPEVLEIPIGNWMLCRMTEAKDGSIWLGSGNGVYRYQAMGASEQASMRHYSSPFSHEPDSIWAVRK